MKKHFLLVTLLLVFTCPFFAFASDKVFEKGDTFFTVKAGVDFPYFEYFPNKEDGLRNGSEGTNLSLGGYASLAYQSFINEKTALGGELGYCFNYSSGKVLSLIPISVKISYLPVQSKNIDICLNGNAGIGVLKFDSRRQISGFAQISVQPMYFFNENWAVGVESGIMVASELYFSSNPLSADNCLAGFVPLTLSFTYNR